MAKQTINTLKGWFQRGLKPLQSQFWDLFDSYWHKDETIPAASIQDLTDLFDEKANSYHSHVSADILDLTQTITTVIESEICKTIRYSNITADALLENVIPNNWRMKSAVIKSNNTNVPYGISVKYEDSGGTFASLFTETLTYRSLFMLGRYGNRNANDVYVCVIDDLFAAGSDMSLQLTCASWNNYSCDIIVKIERYN